MVKIEEIHSRVRRVDTARSMKRAAVAQKVGELAHHRAVLAEQLNDIERELGDALVAAQDVIDVGELAQFTDVPAADLTRWFTARRTTRPKRKRSTEAANAESNTCDKRSSTKGPSVASAAITPGPERHTDLANAAADAHARVPADAT